MAKKIGLLCLVPFLLFWHWFEPAARRNQKGRHDYQQQKYQEALQEFLSAKGFRPDTAVLQNNTAAALYQMKKYKEALEELSRINLQKSHIPASVLNYNLGNTYFRLQQYEEALASYKKSLLADPDNLSTKKNFELTLQKMREQQQQNQQGQQQNEQAANTENLKQHDPIMQFLNQNEKEQLEKKKRPLAPTHNEKDW